eukprot:m.2836 g.2836  ORF g.2836 m.2836 type:complete len:277 (-) comp1951_c0_seq1:40-870(-)
MREREIATRETEFTVEALHHGFVQDGTPLRLDGREQNDFRKVQVKFGSVWGQSTVRIGDTRVISLVTCKVTTPTEGRPSDGFVRYGVDMSPMASLESDTSKEEVSLTRLLEHVFRDSKAIDTESLCISAGEKVWSIDVRVTVINDDGNVGDASVLAALAGLLHFRRPHVSMEGEKIVIHTLEEHEPVSLSINHKPINITTALFDNMITLTDPTRMEMRCSNGAVLVAMNSHHELCCINTTGCAISPEEMETIITGAKPHVAQILKKLDEAFSAILP